MYQQHWKSFLYSALYFIGLFLNAKSFSHREERIFFPIIPFYRVQTIAPVPCIGIGPDNLDGTCTTVSQCRNAGLTATSPCQGTQGFCCVETYYWSMLDIKYCGGTSSSPVVYFRSPAVYSDSCSLTITKTNSSICQLRLDFISFSLPQPVRGTCDDFLQLSVGENFLPRLCGENAGEHVYVEFLPNCDDQTLSFKFLNPTTTTRTWDIKITQIPCNSPLAAPRGCLQYYTSVIGTVKSFNYGAPVANVLRQLSPLNYSICVLPQYGYCSIRWTNSSTASSFILQNQTQNAGQTPVCENNYIAIPNPDCIMATCPPRNRFCGSNFTGAISSARIFQLQVVNNYPALQMGQVDTGDSGFLLRYQQMACN